SGLGLHTLSASDATTTDNFSVTIVTPASPTYELGNGDVPNTVSRSNGLTFILSGNVGATIRVYGSLSNVPSSNAYLSLAIGNNFTTLFNGGNYTIPAAGWVQVTIPSGSLPDPGISGTTFYSQAVDLQFPAPLAVSNFQQIFMVQ